MRHLHILLVISAALASGCASAGGGGTPTPAPFPRPGGRPVASEPESPVGPPSSARPVAGVEPAAAEAPATVPAPMPANAIVATALGLQGTPYRLGGANPTGFDCSGLVQYVFDQHGIPMPRVTAQQFEVGQQVDMVDLRPGDLVFFSTIARGPSHVGIAVGGGAFVHAPNSRGWVRTERLDNSYWRQHFIGAKRVE